MPWLVLAGSGGLADFLSDLLENLSSAPAAQSSGEGDGEAGPSVDLKDRVAERVRKHFPSDTESDKLVEQVSAVDREVYEVMWVLTCRTGRSYTFSYLTFIFMTSDVFRCYSLRPLDLSFNA